MHAGFKIVPGSFYEDSVFLDLVLHFLMHGKFWLHHSTRSGSFCRGLELFCSSLEVSFFGLVVMPRIVEGAVRAAVTLSSIVGWGCFFAAVNGVGLFLCSSSGVGLFCSTRSGVGLFCSGFSSNNFVSSHSSVMPILYAVYWRLGERRDGAVSRVVFVIFLYSLYNYIVLLKQCYVAMPSGYKLVITRALGMHGIYCTQPSGLTPSCFSAIYSIHPLCPCYNYNVHIIICT